MRKLIFFFILSMLSLPLRSQVIVGNFGIQYVSSAPSGSCSPTAFIQIVQPAGSIYTCQSGTWGQGGGTGGPFLPLAGGTMTGATGEAPITGGINATALEVNGTNADLGMIYNAIVDGGATGNGTTDDTAALTAGCKAATGAGKIFFIPAATYKVSGTVTCNPSPGSGNIIRIKGVHELSRLVSTSTTADILHVGNGNACATPGLVCGFVESVVLQGPTSTPAQNGQRALLLDDLTQFRVEDVDEGNTDIGFDLINNCYGAIFTNNRGGFFGNNNVSFNMRTGTQSGNQIFLHDDWFGGALAAVYMSPGADGLIITGGQYSLLNVATPSATQAVFMIGIDYLTSATGAIGTIEISGIDTEGAGGWWIHTFGTTALTVSDSDFLDNGTHMSYGVMKAENALTSRFTFRDINWGQGLNAYFSPFPITIAGNSGNTLFFSSGWRTPSGVTLTFNNGGTSWITDRSMDPCVITNTILGGHGGLHCVSFEAPFNTQRTTLYLDDGIFLSTDGSNTFQSTNAASASPTWTQLLPVSGGTMTGATGGAPITGGINATQLEVNGVPVVGLPSGSQGQPLVNTSGSTTYATSGIFLDASQFAGADPSVQINACTAALFAAGGGVCDLRSFTGTYTMSQTIALGTATSAHTNHFDMTYLAPTNGTWKWGLTGGTACGILQYNGTAFIGSMPVGSGGNYFKLDSVAGANMDALFCTDPAPAGGGSYVTASGFQLANSGAGTFANGLIHIQSLFDTSHFDYILANNPIGDGWHIEGAGYCSFTGDSGGSATNGSGGYGFVIGKSGTGTTSNTFNNIVANVPGTGKSDILVQGGAFTDSNTFIGISMEGNGAVDTTSPMFDNSGENTTVIGGLFNTEAGSNLTTKYAFRNSGAHFHVLGTAVVQSTACVNDTALSVTVPCGTAVSTNIFGVDEYIGGTNSTTTISTLTTTGKHTTAASTTTVAGLNLPQGAAPTSPVNGDLWTTSSGLFAQIAGGTVGPFTGGTMVYPGAGLPLSTGSAWATSLTYAATTGLLYDAAGTLSFNATLPTAAMPALTGDCTNSAGALATTCLSTNGVAFGTAATVNTGTSGATIPLLNGANTYSGVSIFTAAGAASTPISIWTGALATGTGTTAFPSLYYDCSGSTAPTNFSTSGTVFGSNTCSGFAGNIFDFHANGAGVATLSASGTLTLQSTINSNGLEIPSGANYGFSSTAGNTGTKDTLVCRLGAAGTIGIENASSCTNTTAGANGAFWAGSINLIAARKGTFVCTGAGTITISNANEAATSDVIISMNAQGGTITTPPAMKTVTGGTGFTVLCGATDTSTYNYDILN